MSPRAQKKKSFKMAKKPVVSAVPSEPTIGSSKQAAAQAKPKRVSPKASMYVVIDYPKQGEVISTQHYSIRIGSSEKWPVDISINNNEWQPCRQNGGYWWYDWQKFSSGINKITARIRNEKGKTLKKSTICECQVS